MIRWRAGLPGLLLAGRVACGGVPAATISQAVTSATATAVPANASGGAAAPTNTAIAPGADPIKAPTKPAAAVTATATEVGPVETPTPSRDPQPGGPVPAG